MNPLKYLSNWIQFLKLLFFSLLFHQLYWIVTVHVFLKWCFAHQFMKYCTFFIVFFIYFENYLVLVKRVLKFLYFLNLFLLFCLYPLQYWLLDIIHVLTALVRSRKFINRLVHEQINLAIFDFLFYFEFISRFQKIFSILIEQNVNISINFILLSVFLFHKVTGSLETTFFL